MEAGWRDRSVGGLPVGDVALAAACTGIGWADVLLTPDWQGPTALSLAAATVMSGAIAWRRRAPLAPVAVVFGTMIALALTVGSSQTWTSVFTTIIAVYSYGAYGTSLAPGIAILVVGTVIRDVNDPMIRTLGDALWTSTMVSLVLLAGLGGGALRRQRRRVEQRAEQVERGEAALVAAAIAEERQRIARELHDIVSHSLGVLVLQAGAAESAMARDPAGARATLQSMRVTGQEALAEMGTLLGLVRGSPEPSRQPQPSLADLDRLVAGAQDTGVRVRLEVDGSRRRLPAALELSAFRVVQEGLTNALKHAAAQEVAIRIGYGSDALDVTVCNDGQALESAPGARRGLAGMRERVEIFGGRLEAGPAPDAAWRLHAVFPVPR